LNNVIENRIHPNENFEYLVKSLKKNTNKKWLILGAIQKIDWTIIKCPSFFIFIVKDYVNKQKTFRISLALKYLLKFLSCFFLILRSFPATWIQFAQM
jgi:hypothetical protein